MSARFLLAVAIAAAALVAVQPAAGSGDPDVAALQVALRTRGLYGGTIDGVQGPETRKAVRRLQRAKGLAVDGVVGTRTRRVLGRHGRPRLGTRPLSAGAVGWDVAALQFLLAWHGFPSGTFDGAFGPRLEAAVQRYQQFAGLGVDGVAGPSTIQHVRSVPLPRSPLRFAWPLAGAVGDVFGPRGDRFHAGIDIPARSGVGVGAARSGHVVFAGWDSSGYGNLVVVAHGRGVETFYAHLSRIAVAEGDRVAAGERVGRVGSTGRSTGPHLHFEVRVRGAAVDPLGALR